jgi:hypothetical protein
VFGLGAQILLALVIAFSVGGIVAVPYAVSQVAAGNIDLPSLPDFAPGGDFPSTPGLPGLGGNVAPGTVAFGSSVSLSNCTLSGQTFVADANDEIFWLAQFTNRTSITDDVRLRVTLDGTEILNSRESRGTYDCLGVDTPEVGLTPGIYVFEILINGTVDARGTLFVS